MITLCSFSISPSATLSRFSTPGVRSLPLTPPGPLERPNAAISCPDGLAHALSEQNLRLQQIVYEHKVSLYVLKPVQLAAKSLYKVFFEYARSPPIITIFIFKKGSCSLSFIINYKLFYSDLFAKFD